MNFNYDWKPPEKPKEEKNTFDGEQCKHCKEWFQMAKKPDNSTYFLCYTCRRDVSWLYPDYDRVEEKKIEYKIIEF